MDVTVKVARLQVQVQSPMTRHCRLAAKDLLDFVVHTEAEGFGGAAGGLAFLVRRPVHTFELVDFLYVHKRICLD